MPLQRKLQAAIQDVARENGYAYVLPKEALLVAPPGDDLAAMVRRKLGMRAASTSAPASAPTTAPSKVKVKTK